MLNSPWYACLSIFSLLDTRSLLEQQMHDVLTHVIEHKPFHWQDWCSASKSWGIAGELYFTSAGI
jgi:hypothetical protein